MGSLKKAIKRVPAFRHPVTEAIKCWRQHSDLGRVITRNIIRERFLSSHRMVALLKAVCDGPTSTTEQFAETYGKACHAHVLKGELAEPDPSPQVLGRAVDHDTFVKWLNEQGVTEEDAKKLITKLDQGDPID